MRLSSACSKQLQQQLEVERQRLHCVTADKSEALRQASELRHLAARGQPPQSVAHTPSESGSQNARSEVDDATAAATAVSGTEVDGDAAAANDVIKQLLSEVSGDRALLIASLTRRDSIRSTQQQADFASLPTSRTSSHCQPRPRGLRAAGGCKRRWNLQARPLRVHTGALSKSLTTKGYDQSTPIHASSEVERAHACRRQSGTPLPWNHTHTHTVRLCVAFLLRVSVAVLLELTELAKPVEMPCLCCNTHTHTHRCTELAKPVEMPRLCCNTHALSQSLTAERHDHITPLHTFSEVDSSHACRRQSGAHAAKQDGTDAPACGGDPAAVPRDVRAPGGPNKRLHFQGPRPGGAARRARRELPGAAGRLPARPRCCHARAPPSYRVLAVTSRVHLPNATSSLSPRACASLIPRVTNTVSCCHARAHSKCHVLTVATRARLPHTVPPVKF